MEPQVPVTSVKIFYSLDDVISPYMATFFVAFVVALIATPLMGMLAHRYGIVDRPNYRKSHTRPIAYLGGVALLLAWLSGTLVSGWLSPHTIDLMSAPGNVEVPPGILWGAVVVMGVGLADDVFRVRARYRIFGQALAAGCLIHENIGLKLVEGTIGAVGSFVHIDMTAVTSHYLAGLAAALVVTFFVIGACNATNLLDGMDGLASGVTGVVALGLGFIAVALATGMYGEGGAYSISLDPVRIVLSLALLGAVMGFLPYNFKPASIFMGDAGSMLLGYLCVTMILLFGERGEPLPVIAGLTVFTLPILDTALAIVRRRVKGHPVAAPDNYHLHHMLTRAGLGVRRAVLVLYALATAFAVIGCSMVFFRLRFVAAIFMVMFSFIAIMSYKIAHHFYHTDKQAQGKTATPSRPQLVVAPIHVPGAGEGHDPVKPHRTRELSAMVASVTH